MRTVPIAFAFDNNFILPACVCISSLMMSADKETFYDIFILHSHSVELDRRDLDKIPEIYPNCRISYRQVDGTFDKAFEIRGITTSTYYRLLIPELIQEYDKILYSDVDVIFRSDMSDFYFSSDLSGCYVAGVNALVPMVPDYRRYYEKMGDIDMEGIIYAGNIILNSKLIREDGMTGRFRKLARNRYRFQDLDVLNIACKGKIRYLAPAFCLTTTITELSVNDRSEIHKYWNDREIDTALKSGTIHYNGQKPWQQYCINFDIWWEYYRKSPFYDEKFHFDFFYYRLNIFDQLPLLKRIKILVRYFVYGKRVI